MPDLSDAQKAKVAFLVTLIGSLATWAVTKFPDSTSVQEWGGLILAVLTIVTTTYGVWKTTNGTPRFQVPPAPVTAPSAPPTTPPVA